MTNQLSSSISKLVDSHVLDFISKVSQKYNIKDTELKNIWNKSSDSTSVKSSPSSKPVRKTPPRVSAEEACPYVFKSGKNTGGMCGAKIKEGGFCGRHQPKENKKTFELEKHPKLGIFWNKKSTLAFNTTDDPLTCVGFVKGDNLLPLTRKETDMCVKLGIAYELPKEESESEEERGEDENEVSEGGEELIDEKDVEEEDEE